VRNVPAELHAATRWPPGPALLVASLEEVLQLAAVTGALFLHYGHGPALSAAPTDAESGCRLPGLPVAAVVPEPWWDRPAEHWLARQVCQHAHLWGGGERCWLLSGEVVGRGADGEPLLSDVVVLGLLGPACLEQAGRVYRTAFGVRHT
jgi:hypothetical protein